MRIKVDQLNSVAPFFAGDAAQMARALSQATARFGIATSLQLAHFLTQLVRESAHFTRTREILDYSPEDVIAIFNATVPRFTPAQAEQFGRTAAHKADQKMIANIAYANRLGNGDVTSGDGWKHRGAGFIQLTGKALQIECTDFFDIHPDVAAQWLSTHSGAALSAAWFWKKNGLNKLADADDVHAVLDLIAQRRRTVREGDAARGTLASAGPRIAEAGIHQPEDR